MALDKISIRGAREHNLKGVDIDIPHNKLVVITGLSGSGKSSLAFDTIYAEGQRKYVESLSAYARQFLEQLQKPDIESIEGLPPTIAIEQRSASHNPRSTVATTTEIYDYLRLLLARAGHPRCWHTEGSPESRVQSPESGKAADRKTRDAGLGTRDSAKRCGHAITSQSATQIVDHVFALPEGSKMMLLAPVVRGKKGHHKEVFEALSKQGFVRARVDGQVMDLREITAKKEGTPFTSKVERYQQHSIDAVIDRVVLHKDDEGGRQRIVDSIELSLKLADGLVIVSVADDAAPPETGGWTDTLFSEKYACPLHPECSLPDLEPRLFSFNSPYGACPSCGGLGTIMEFDPELIVPDPKRALSDGAVDAWRKYGPRMNNYYARMIRQFCKNFGADIDAPYEKLGKACQKILMHGTTAKDEAKYDTHFEGVVPHLQKRWESTESEWVKARLHGYLSEAPCETCKGARLKTEAMHVFLQVQGVKPGDPAGDAQADAVDAASPGPRALGVTKRDFVNADDLDPHTHLFHIDTITRMTIEQATDFFKRLDLSHEESQIAAPILKEIQARLGFMMSVGLGYLSLNRATGTLSGGEAQRIRLATQVGSGLVGCCYVLDEPTIGLHQRDNDRLIRTLRHLSDIGNTVIVVEHDEDTIRAADWLIDIGPGPGRHGGRVTAEGTVEEVTRNPRSLTGRFLSGDRVIAVPTTRRELNHKAPLVVKGCTENNLKDVDATFPLGGLVCVTGVSGSGKSTLVNQILLRAVRKQLLASRDKPGAHKGLTGWSGIERIIEVDQSPIGRTPRSNPATYTGTFDSIRDLFTKTKEAKIRGYKPGRFSFNVKGGRCEACQGQGTKKIEMHFLPDVFVECDVCKGARYNRETLEVKYRGKNIADVLQMTVEEALGFFENFPDIHRMMTAVNDVGLSYIQLGQASTTLSGGEAQRVKLAAELGKRSSGHTLYILDEPTTGLHFADVEKLLEVIGRLADQNNTVVVIEHNMDIIKCADWLVDLGPEGGSRGGTIVAAGTPEDVAKVDASYTGHWLRSYLPATKTKKRERAVAMAG